MCIAEAKKNETNTLPVCHSSLIIRNEHRKCTDKKLLQVVCMSQLKLNSRHIKAIKSLNHWDPWVYNFICNIFFHLELALTKIVSFLNKSRGRKCIVFCNTSKSCNWMSHKLDSKNIKHSKLHGNMDPQVRLLCVCCLVVFVVALFFVLLFRWKGLFVCVFFSFYKAFYNNTNTILVINKK